MDDDVPDNLRNISVKILNLLEAEDLDFSDCGIVLALTTVGLIHGFSENRADAIQSTKLLCNMIIATVKAELQ